MRFMTLSGVDGSGKSTQLRLLREHLDQRGRKVAYFHAVEFSLANRLARLLKGKHTFEPGQERAVTQASLFPVLLRQELLFWDMLRFRFWRRHLRLEGYDTILSDRSFSDSLVNIEYLSSSPFVRFWNRVLAWCMPRADAAFFLDLPAEAILARTRVPEQGKEYLERKLALFRAHAQEWSLISIDANQEPQAVFQCILPHLRSITDSPLSNQS